MGAEGEGEGGVVERGGGVKREKKHARPPSRCLRPSTKEAQCRSLANRSDGSSPTGCAVCTAAPGYVVKEMPEGMLD